ncbi:cellulase family glycosylhydrolase [Marinilabilia salmonicolor]|uniref:cellulase family glycosylhydrolase n=1 Tax=Marinilabilia salmonicolor TaxID=989 RepID=UPI00029A4371|nr:cellulase family glycosylhydrolase [Marinilabilia salmonicolor]
MKKLAFFFFLSLLSLQCSSCSDDDPNEEAFLSVSVDELSFPANSGSKFLNIQSNRDWVISERAVWLNVDMLFGSAADEEASVAVTVQKNPDADERTALIAISADGLTQEVVVTQAGSELMIIEEDRFEIDASGGNFSVNLQVTNNYDLTIQGDWISQNKSLSEASEDFSVASNSSIFQRTGLVIFAMGDIKDTVTVVQSGIDAFIPADMTGMESTAIQLASKMNMGWNLGNSMEPPSGETAWGNPKTTQALIDAVAAAGFNAVRIPCAWDSYIEDLETNKIKDSWLARVQEVVDYCYANDMYVILNIHWDGGWLEENIIPEKEEEVSQKQEALWKQIAIHFRDYDEHLLFAGTNEPNVEDAEQMGVLLNYEQVFIDAVRATGGCNAYRVLIFQGPSTDIDKTHTLMTALPQDDVEDRLMAEVHYYTPWNFCGLTQDENWGDFYYFWGGNYHIEGAEGRYPDWDCEEDYVLAQFQKMKTQFVDNGIPVILGEFGAIRRTISDNAEWQQLHYESRAYFNRYVTEQAKNYGMVPFYWDEGSLTNHGFGMMDRNQLEVGDQLLYDALMEGSNAGEYPF